MRVLFCFILLITHARAQDSVLKQLAQQVYVKATVSKTTCYVGEPVELTYALYTRVQSESKVVKRPGFKGFGVYDMVAPESGISSTATVNGNLFSVYILRKVQLYPLQAGIQELESMEVENDILIDQKHYQLLSKTAPITIKVSSLPKTTQEYFNGAVGQFSVEASVHKSAKPKVNDLLELKLSIKGKGNFPVIGLPEIQWPSEIEAYAAKLNEQYSRQVIPLTGEKNFLIPFLSKKQGKQQIPSIAFTFFDPAKQTYTTVRTTAIPLFFDQPVKYKPTVSLPVEKRSPSIWWIFLLLMLLVLAVFISRKKKKKTIEPIPVIVPEPSWEETTLRGLQTAMQENQPVVFYKTLLEGLERCADPMQQKDGYRILKQKANIVLYTPFTGDTQMEKDYQLFVTMIR